MLSCAAIQQASKRWSASADFQSLGMMLEIWRVTGSVSIGPLGSKRVGLLSVARL